MRLRSTAALTLLGLAIGCGGGAGGGETETAAAEPGETEMAAPAMAAASGEFDQALASQGETLFQTKACMGCHTVGGGRLTGPDLQGVTERREMDWIVAMITNPDSMLQNDEAARELLREYATPMAPLPVTADEARAIIEYLKREGAN